MRAVGSALRAFVRYAVYPAIFYTCAFIALTYPWVRLFATHYYANDRDGFQNIWNLWWMNKAITELHQSPWYTTYLHYPNGISLYVHTLGPFNGLLAIPLLRGLSLIQTHNALVAFGFVMGGVTAFWLAYTLTRSYAGSLIGGYTFTFSEFHFVQAHEGHMNLVSLEWLPLFALTFYCLVTRPGVSIAVAAALSLFAVLLCDYYYFLYAIVTAVLLIAWFGHKGRDWLFWLKAPWMVPAAWFATVSLATTAPLLAGFVWAYRRDVFAGAHSPLDFSLDVPLLFVPGTMWRFSELVTHYVTRLPTALEKSPFIGYATMGSLLYVWQKRRAARLPDVGLWSVLMLMFGILALGPRLHIAGYQVPFLRLPYGVLETLVPIVTLSGVPVRMIVMVTLAGSLFVAEAFRLWLENRHLGHVALACAFATLIVFEHLPGALPATRVPMPDVVSFLRDHPGPEGYFDATGDPFGDAASTDEMAYRMYYQTIHQMPIAGGYTSRTTEASIARDQELRRLVSQGEFLALRCTYRFKWLLSERVIDQKGVLLTRHWPDPPENLYELAQNCDAGTR